MKRLLLPGIPFLLSFALSLSTAGPHCSWQDSGFFLVAVKDLGVLYPPGFTLYLLLCKAWTLALGFLDFAYAVHLFSAFCAALAAGTIAVAARDLLSTRGPLFRCAEDPGPLPAWIGASIGCLAAAGYTFWSAAILAKVYALYFLILSLLLWRLIRADESGKPRDFTIVAALIGLAWQAHPSAVTAGLALLLFVAAHRRTVGARGIALRVALAAACALLPSLALLIFASREPSLMFGDPRDAGAFLGYLTGARFTGHSGAFGLDATRVVSIGRYFWEEFLGVGALAAAAGVARMIRSHRRLLGGLAAWAGPAILVPLLFKMEGQHDQWFVSAWIVVWLAAAIGLHAAASAARERGRAAAAAAALAGVAWAVAVNRPDLDQRRYELAETLGHLQLDLLDEHAVLVSHSDDVSGSARFLQRVRGVRPDVVLVQDTFLGQASGWYERVLQRRHPFLVPPDYAVLRSRFPRQGALEIALGGFGNANASRERPVFFERPPRPELLSPEWTLVPAGQLLKLVPRSEARADPKYWRTTIAAESLPPLYRRERGQDVETTADGVKVRPEAYEHRLLRELLRARKNQADWIALSGTAEGYRRCAELYESILALDPSTAGDPGAVVPLARAYYAMGRLDLAEPWLKKAVELPLPPAIRAQICCLLVDLYRAQKRPDQARAWASAALAIPELPADLRARLEGR